MLIVGVYIIHYKLQLEIWSIIMNTCGANAVALWYYFERQVKNRSEEGPLSSALVITPLDVRSAHAHVDLSGHRLAELGKPHVADGLIQQPVCDDDNYRSSSYNFVDRQKSSSPTVAHLFSYTCQSIVSQKFYLIFFTSEH